MEPTQFLWLMLAITAAAAGWQWARESARRRGLRRLAHGWRMHFVHDDRFHLSGRIGRRLPVVGAAGVEARDLMYKTEGHRRRYLFTVEFGQGTVIKQRRRRYVAMLEEQAAPPGSHAPVEQEGEEPTTLLFAPLDLPLFEQYRRLHEGQALEGRASEK